MKEYSFTELNPNEFENLVNDLLGKHYTVLVERFKPGKDQGIDGRFFCPKNDSVTIIQSKHYANSKVTKLLSALKHTELPKIKRLNPSKYIEGINNFV